VSRELVVLWAGRHRRSSWVELCDAYRRRIALLAPVRELPVRARAGARDPQRRRAEGQALLAALPQPSFCVALDGGGEALDSARFAQRLAHLREEWPHATCFVIGSDLGLDSAVLETARWVLSLGPLTLSHELARLVLYEQLYRALSITAGMSYHREPP
jgi:23S rRNA (pseudouridine1915-N3)-methyltransferase